MAATRRVLAPLLLLTAAVLTGCGGGHSPATSTTSAATAAKPAATPQPAAFTWLHPAPAPRGWAQAALAGSARLAYPSSWRRVRGDPGTMSAALLAPGSDRIVEYLNATPQEGAETLANWPSFRPEHNGDEGDKRVQLLTAARGLRFRDGRGSCVIDRYQTDVGRYQEIACLVRGPSGGTVIVAAALAGQWARDAPVLERAVSAFLA